jgi:hypothetical protein
MNRPNQKTTRVAIIVTLVIIIISFLKKRINMNTEKTIYTTLKGEGIPEILSLLIVAQTKHETSIGGVPYTSRQFLINNNIAGYGYVKGNKYQIMDGGKHPEDGGHYAKYANIIDSAKDLAGWYKRRSNTFFRITDIHAFANALKTSGYYTDKVSNYENGVRRFYKTQIV